MLKLYMEPQYDVPDRAEGGIRRVVEAMGKYLPAHGIELVREIRQADLTVGHGVLQPIKPDVPFVSACHGLHWADYTWSNWAHEVNRAVIEALVRAQAVTAPSQWVAHALTRGMLVEPEVIYHGVDADEWAHEEKPEGYVFWNKARRDPVSNPDDMQKLAQLLPEIPFVTTLGEPAPNVAVLGVQPVFELKPYLQRAGLYLATARETFGIGTLEALASGVPVVGWDYGGQSEIILAGETGYLAPYGDYEALADCVVRARRERARLAANARADAVARWGWQARIAQYADLYKRVAAEWHSPGPKVSVIVTCHNLARFLPDALESVKAQTLPDWECLVVDDASADDTPQVAGRFANARVKYLPTPRNLKLSGARNFGFQHARGKYILHLDADDKLPPYALELLASALDRDPGLHIAYGSLDVMNMDGSNQRRNEFPQHFHWHGQMAHINQLHYAAMLRRAVLERAGGYRERMWRAEDAELWCRVTSFGFRAAKVTDETTLVYRMRNDSKSADEYHKYADKDGDWCAWFPWRIADTGPKGAQILRQFPNQVPNAQLVPFAAQGTPPHGRFAWDVWHRQTPRVSVIIPVGPGHREHVLNALDSLIAQDVGDWEAIVVNDSGDAWDKVAGAPFARVLSTKGKQGPAAARNVGLDAARGELVLFLDGDDWLLPSALRQLLEAYARGDVAYVFSDYMEVNAGWSEVYKEVLEFDQQDWKGPHAITVLMATAHARDLRFDETLAGWEDWDFFLRCKIRGFCGRRIPAPLFAYRFSTGTRREGDLYERGETILAELRTRYGEHFEGKRPMANCCPGGGQALLAARLALEANAMDVPLTAGAAEDGHATDAAEIAKSNARVRMEFIGERMGGVTYTVNGHAYRGGNNPHDKFADADAADAAGLERLGVWRVKPLPPPVLEPEPVRDAVVLPVAKYEPPQAAEPTNGHAPHIAADQLVLTDDHLRGNRDDKVIVSHRKEEAPLAEVSTDTPAPKAKVRKPRGKK